jgi:transcriptional regulator with XRE-family HTH domain
MKRTPRAKIIRRAFGLTQEQFAACFRIPIGTIRDWEQGISEPDAAARAYLIVIATDPIAVCKAFVATPGREESKIIGYSNLGVLYQAKGDLAQAEAQFRKALDLGKAHGHKEGMARAHMSLAALHEKRGDKPTARKHWRKAREFFAEVEMPEMAEQAERSLHKVERPRG